MFTGQERIKRELTYIIKDIINNDRNYNILLSAPSGHGKTTLALKILNTLGLDDSNIAGPPRFTFDPSKRFHFMDEVHELQSPEPLYQLMDRGDYVIVLATNEVGLLKEPLVNRCIPLIFEPYTENELKLIVQTSLMCSLDDSMLTHLVNVSKSNPRVAKTLCNRLNIVFQNFMVPRTMEELESILKDILSIEGGYNAQERRYLEYLTRVKRASLDSIVNATRIDRSTILRDIEPGLLYNSVIRISSKGREIYE